jgi:hypothetical protein
MVEGQHALAERGVPGALGPGHSIGLLRDWDGVPGAVAMVKRSGAYDGLVKVGPLGSWCSTGRTERVPDPSRNANGDQNCVSRTSSLQPVWEFFYRPAELVSQSIVVV